MTASVSSWSRRRAAVAAEAAALDAAAEQAQLDEQHAHLAEKPDGDILEELGLPDPDTMVQGDDFKAFLDKAVPAHIRKRALRKLWRSNPVLACVDGLNDYDDDYLTGSFGQDPIRTTYQVGKGMLAHLLEMDRQKLAAEDAPEKSEVVEEAIADEQEELVVEAEDAVAQEASAAEAVADEPSAYTPRRMTFHFEDNTA